MEIKLTGGYFTLNTKNDHVRWGNENHLNPNRQLVYDISALSLLRVWVKDDEDLVNIRLMT